MHRSAIDIKAELSAASSELGVRNPRGSETEWAPVKQGMQFDDFIGNRADQRIGPGNGPACHNHFNRAGHLGRIGKLCNRYGIRQIVTLHSVCFGRHCASISRAPPDSNITAPDSQPCCYRLFDSCFHARFYRKQWLGQLVLADIVLHARASAARSRQGLLYPPTVTDTPLYGLVR